MIFKESHFYVMVGRKTATRRVVKPGEYEYWKRPDGVFYQVRSANGRIKWEVGRKYAVQEGRSKAATGWIRLVGLRREYLQEITPEDAMREGTWIEKFPAQWDRWNLKAGTRWADNPEVWVLEFELMDM